MCPSKEQLGNEPGSKAFLHTAFEGWLLLLCSHQGYHHNHYLLSCTVYCIVSCIPNDNERGQKFDLFLEC